MPGDGPKTLCPLLSAGCGKRVACLGACCAWWTGDKCSQAKAAELERFCNWLAARLMEGEGVISCS